jgi:hypothetical protein
LHTGVTTGTLQQELLRGTLAELQPLGDNSTVNWTLISLRDAGSAKIAIHVGRNSLCARMEMPSRTSIVAST